MFPLGSDSKILDNPTIKKKSYMKTVTERHTAGGVTTLGAFGDHGTAPIVIKICTRLVYR